MDPRHPHARWEAARSLVAAGEPASHVAAYEHQRVVLQSALAQYKGILRDCRNVDSAAVARRNIAEYSARLTQMGAR